MPTSERTRARPAVAITTPSLTRHMVFYFPFREISEHETGDTAPLDDKTSRKLHKKLDMDPLDEKSSRDLILEYVRNLKNKSTSQGIAMDCPEHDVMQHAMENHASFGFNYGDFLGMKVRVIIVLYQEHFTISFILDNEGTDGHKAGPLPKITSSVDSLVSYLREQLLEYEERTPSFKRVKPETILQLSKYEGNDEDWLLKNDLIYREVWAAFDVYMGNNMFLQRKWVSAVKEDIRGVIITPEKCLPKDSSDSCNGVLQRYRDESNNKFTSADAHLKRNRQLAQFMDNEVEFVFSALSLDTSSHQSCSAQPSMRWDQNSILCYIGEGAAAYGSSLFFLSKQKWGEQDDVGRSHMDEFKINKKLYDYRRYFVFFDGINDYTIGRIVRRIHILSELRCISFVERSNILSLHDVLREIGDRLNDIYEKMTASKVPTVEIDKLVAVVRTYAEATARRTSLEKRMIYRPDLADQVDPRTHFAREGANEIEFYRCNGGLSYRISRSKYYYEQLVNRISDMGVWRIKGFQPYDRFIYRNYFQMHQSIVSIGERSGLLGTRIDRALSTAHTLQQRLIAQYALRAAIGFAIFTAISAVAGSLNYVYGGNTLRPGWILIMSASATIIIFLIILFITSYSSRKKGLWVLIKEEER